MTKELSEVETLAIQTADAAYEADYKDSKWHGLLDEDARTLAMAKGEEAYAAGFPKHGVVPSFTQMYWRVRDRRAAEYIAREDARIERERPPGIADDDGFSAPHI